MHGAVDCAESDAEMRLDPWHGLETLRPLGGASRLRKHIYPVSNRWRKAMNARPDVSVHSIDDIPDV